MRSAVRALLSVTSLAALAALPPARAQSTAPADEKPATPAAPTAAPKRERVVSGNLAATLAASMPKYNPPPKPHPDEEEIDLREVDKPRNNIIRLPKYTVRDKRPPVFRERDIYSSKGLAELARRRYLTPTFLLLNGLRLPLVSASPEEHAMALYAEDERLANMADLRDTAATLERGGDSAASTYVKRASTETYMRSADFTWRPGQER